MASCCASGPGSSMQKLSACRNRDWLIHFFFSTSSLCIIAIWPVGPPKEMKPSFSQNWSASRNDGARCTNSRLDIAAMESKAEGRCDFQNDLAAGLGKSAIVVLPALIDDEKKVIARTPCPAEPAVQTDLPRNVIVLRDRAPGQVRSERQVDARAGDVYLEVTFPELDFSDLVCRVQREKARWPPIEFAAVIAARAAVIIAKTQPKTDADWPSGAGRDVSLEKSVRIIANRNDYSRKDLKGFVHDVALKGE